MTTAIPLAYADELVPARQDQIDRWRVIVTPDARTPTLIGDCPVCGHRCETTVSEVVVKGGAPSAAGSASPPQMTRQIVCNCRIDHDPTTGAVGCGRYWLVTLRLQADGTYRLTAESDLRLLPAAEALRAAVAAQDKRIQAAAEKWVVAVSAIVGLFSLTGIATAKDALTGLRSELKWLVAGALVTALGLAASALVSGYHAAYGWPATVDVSDNAKLLAWHDDYRRYAQRAASGLRTAVVFAFAALGALIAVMLLVWFLPRVPTK
jgi:hypothetical protein